MIKSYFKIGWRSLFKNKGYSFINIGGLAIGLACCITIGLYIWDEFSYDRFHTQKDHIYRVVEKQNKAGVSYNIAVTPGPLAAALKANFAEVQQTCRIRTESEVLQSGRIKIESAKMLKVDNSFFTVFAFPIVKGNYNKALVAADEVVITEKMALLFFGPDWKHADNILGQPIRFGTDRDLKVTGVVQDPPVNSHIQFDILLSVHMDDLYPDNFHWDNNNYHTYIRLKDGVNASELDQKLSHYLARYLHDPDNERTTSLTMQPLLDIHLHSDFAFRTDWAKTSSILHIRIFFAVAIVVLLIAIFNFINLSTARATQRAKEVGVRKVIGAFHKQLVIQFLSESLLMTALAVASAFVLVLFFLPLLNDIAGKALTVPVRDPYFGLTILGFMLSVSLLAGIYPAFYLSHFQPVKVLKGFFTTRSGQLFRRSLVVGQFTFSVILIIASIVIYKQLTFLQDKDLGFDQSQLLYVKMKNQLWKGSLPLKGDLENQTSIAGVAAASTNLIDVVNSTWGIHWEGQAAEDKFLITQMNIDPDFFSTTGMKLAAGRNFDSKMVTDTASTYIINETASSRMGWTPEEALGKTVTLWEIKGTVIGVVKDFHFRPMKALIEPLLFRYRPNGGYPGLFVKTKPNAAKEAISVIETLYKKHEHLTEPEYEFVDQALQNQYRTEQNTGRVVLYFSILAVIVSCLGLFGLVTFSTEQRTKEIGIRKVLGASVAGIVNLLSKDLLKLVLVAVVIASPIAWWGMNQWLQDFAYKIGIEWWMFILPGLGAISIALLTVSSQSIKAAMMNPVTSLRSE